MKVGLTEIFKRKEDKQTGKEEKKESFLRGKKQRVKGKEEKLTKTITSKKIK